MIDVRELCFSYKAKNRVDDELTLNNVSFTIEDGEIFGFLGPSGSGKSTTQRILCGLLSNFKGSVSVKNKALEKWGQDYYQLIGVGFELPNHYNALTAKENLELFAAFYNTSISRGLSLLEELGLTAYADKRVSEFSKGMKMRLNFARCLMHDPQLIFLDEPTSGLDPNNARTIKNLIRKEKEKGHSVFLSTHAMHDADELCDQVALIDKGQIVTCDRPEALRARHGESTVVVQYKNTPDSEEVRERIFNLHNLGDDPVFQSLISQNHVMTIHSQEASLEDVFVKLTGRNIQ